MLVILALLVLKLVTLPKTFISIKNYSDEITLHIFFFQNVLKRWSFQKNRTGTWSFMYYLERWGYFYSKARYFFFGRKMKDDLSQEIHVNTIFSVCMYKCYKYYITLLPKKSKTISPEKMHLKAINILERVPMIACTFMETFIGVFIY